MQKADLEKIEKVTNLTDLLLLQNTKIYNLNFYHLILVNMSTIQKIKMLLTTREEKKLELKKNHILMTGMITNLEKIIQDLIQEKKMKILIKH